MKLFTRSNFDEYSVALRSTKNFILLVAVTSLINAVRWSLTALPLQGAYTIAFLVSTVCWIGLSFKKTVSIKLVSLAFWASLLVCLYSFGLTNLVLAQTSINYGAFAGFKMAAIAIAILAPAPVRNGYFGIAACGIIPTILYFSFLSLFRTTASIQEPALTVLTAGVCVVIFYYRNKGLQIERSYAKLAAERESLKEIAHIFLAMRDLCNSPLQSIRFTTSLLENNQMSPKEAAKFLNGAVEKLTQVSRMLADYEQDPKDSSQYNSMYDAFDPILFLQERLEMMQAKARELKEQDPRPQP